MRRVLLVGAPVFFQRPAIRALVALIISVFFLALQIEYKPYASVEHNRLATLACTQITATLLMIALQAAGLPNSEGVGVLCILLNIVLVPVVLIFNARRLKRRRKIFAALSLASGAELTRGVGYSGDPGADQTQFLNPLYFEEAWKAGKKSERDVFTAALSWIDVALERPVSHHRWEQILFMLEQLPLTDSAHGGVQYGTLPTPTIRSFKDYVWLRTG